MRYALIVVGVGLGGTLALADTRGRRDRFVEGDLATSVVACSSLCTESRWNGSLDGTSRFTLISRDDAQVPNANVANFHGDLVLSTGHGDLIGQDAGVWNLDTGKYFDVYTVSSGTGAYAGATAVIVLWGTLDPGNGKGVSHYRGLVTSRRGH